MPLASVTAPVIGPTARQTPTAFAILRVTILLLPAVLLLGAAARANGQNPLLLLILGTGFQILLCAVSLRYLPARRLVGPAALLLYLTGLGWLWLGRGLSDLDDWYLHFAQALLLVVSLAIFGAQVLADSGASEWRRAHLLARRLASRADWPADLSACRLLPEIKALREALHIDAGPALRLLTDSRPQVRVAALAALEFRKNWRPGQAEGVLQVARDSGEPAVRAAAMGALANVDDRLLVEQLAEFLRDPAADVRRAAAEALLWDASARWPWIRLAVRRALADARTADESLLPSGQPLTEDALRDLTAWAAEKGCLAVRAAQALVSHHERGLDADADGRLAEELRGLVAESQTPPALRIGLAHLLDRAGLLDRRILESLLSSSNPAPLRLIAADALLGDGPHAAAAAALREVARLPNREIALATAAIVQRRLHIDVGLPIGQSPPPLHSRLAAEVTRRVMAWGGQPVAVRPEPALR